MRIGKENLSGEIGFPPIAQRLRDEVFISAIALHRAFIDAHRYDHTAVTTLLLVTTEETQLEHLIARKVAAGDVGAVANTIVVMGSERVSNRLVRMLCVVKHRGSAKSDEIAEFRVTERGFELG